MQHHKSFARLGVASLLLLGASTTSYAQGKRGDREHGRRALLEQEYRERAESVVRERLALTDEQVVKLRGVNSRLDVRRRDLLKEERATRQALRAEVAKGGSANQKQVTELMNKAQELQQRRMALQDEERKELSGFLTPVQQAKYFGMQARLRKRAQELEEQE